MNIAIIGRTEILFNTILELNALGHNITAIITAKEAPEYTKNIKDFEELAKKLDSNFSKGIPILKNYKLLESSNAEIAISVNYPEIIPQSIIDLFPLGILNAHGGDLPRYRGNACQAWAILNGEKEIGLCIHKMIGAELDSGDIIARDYLKINDYTKITEIMDWITSKTPKMFINSIIHLQKNKNFVLAIQSKEQSEILRCYPLKPSDGRINWKMSAIRILRLINAFNKPYSGAFSYLDGEKIIIWDAKLVSYQSKFCAMPGQILKITDAYIDVACEDGILRIYKIQVKNLIKRPSEFINSIRRRFSNPA